MAMHILTAQNASEFGGKITVYKDTRKMHKISYFWATEEKLEPSVFRKASVSVFKRTQRWKSRNKILAIDVGYHFNGTSTQGSCLSFPKFSTSSGERILIYHTLFTNALHITCQMLQSQQIISTDDLQNQKRSNDRQIISNMGLLGLQLLI